MSKSGNAEHAGRSSGKSTGPRSGMRRFWSIAIVILVLELLLLGVCNFLVLGSLKKD